MSLLQINSAVALAKPLLEQQQQQDRMNGEDEQDMTGDKLVQGEVRNRTKFLLIGAVTGFFIQMVSLGAYALLLANFNGMTLKEGGIVSIDGFFTPIVSDNNTIDKTNLGEFFGKEAVVYTVLSILTQIDLVVYVFIWIAFTCTMTRNGMACIRSQFFSSIPKSSKNKKESKSDVNRRYIFILGVSFLVGIVFGAFGAWSAIDIYLGFPIPIQPILVTVAVDLFLCYLMVRCFDMGGNSKLKQLRSSNCDEEEAIECHYDGDDENESFDDEDGPAICC